MSSASCWRRSRTPAERAAGEDGAPVPTSPSPPPARRRTGELAPALVLLIAFVALGSCRALNRINQARSVALVGDSITDSAAAELTAAAGDAGWRTTIDATPGAMTV